MEVSLDLPDVLIDRIADAVAARVGPGGGREASPWMDIPTAATYLGTTNDAMRTAAQRGLLPAHQPYGPGSRPRPIRWIALCSHLGDSASIPPNRMEARSRW
jgi:hypothetical protein